MSVSLRREIARLLEQECWLHESATPLDLSRLAELLQALLTRQQTTQESLARLEYPSELITALQNIVRTFDAVHFWMWLDCRGQVLLSLATCLRQVSDFVEQSRNYREQFPQLTHLCLKLTAECDELSVQVLQNFHPLPEMYYLSHSARRIRQVMENIAA